MAQINLTYLEELATALNKPVSMLTPIDLESDLAIQIYRNYLEIIYNGTNQTEHSGLTLKLKEIIKVDSQSRSPAFAVIIPPLLLALNVYGLYQSFSDAIIQ